MYAWRMSRVNPVHGDSEYCMSFSTGPAAEGYVRRAPPAQLAIRADVLGWRMGGSGTLIRVRRRGARSGLFGEGRQVDDEPDRCT